MSAADTWTVGRLLTWTTEFLAKHGADSPRLDAEVLLAHARGCKRIELYTAFEELADDATRTTYRELVKRRAEGMPVAYLVGRREFYSLSFRVTPDVLIPRPETEYVVLALRDRVKERGADAGALAIADVGTGSGILAVCAAKYIPTAQVTAIDVSPAALEVAKENAVEHRVVERVEFIESDLFAAVPADARFDFVVSNPPYIAESEMPQVARDVKEFEPRGALVAGARGTEVIERLIPQAAERLNVGGWLIMEISPMIEPAVLQLIGTESRLRAGPTIKDQAGLPRVVQAQRV